jgi:hypothetical protein
MYAHNLTTNRPELASVVFFRRPCLVSFGWLHHACMTCMQAFAGISHAVAKTVFDNQIPFFC